MITPSPGPDYDFSTYYVAGLLTLERSPEDAFSYEKINLRYRKLQTKEKTGPFLYSPVYLLPSTLLALLPHPAAKWVNHILTLAALTLLFALIVRRLNLWWEKLLLVLFFWFSHIVLSQFLYQNWSVFLALFTLLAWNRTLRGCSFSAGLFWSLTIHLKPYMAFLLLPLWLTKKFRALGFTLLFLILLSMVTLPVTGFRSYRAYTSKITDLSSSGTTPYFNQVSLQATTARFLTPPMEWLRPSGPVDAPWIRYMLVLSFPFMLLILLAIGNRIETLLGVTVIFILLFIPHAWDHMEILLLPLLPLLPRRMFVTFFVFTTGIFLPIGIWLGTANPYDLVVHHLLQQVLVEHLNPLALKSFLLFFPFLNLFCLGGILLKRSDLLSSSTKTPL